MIDCKFKMFEFYCVDECCFFDECGFLGFLVFNGFNLVIIFEKVVCECIVDFYFYKE